MYKLEEGEVIVLDAETNALRLPNKVHVICTRTADEEREFYLRSPHEIQEFKEYLERFSTFVGHNIIQYDLLHVLDRFVPGHPVRSSNALDTLVLSRLFNYSLTGGHSIRAWGERLGVKKVGTGIEQWEVLTDEMVLRCHSDTKISKLILERFLRLVKDPSWFESIRVEHEIAHVCGVMSMNGFSFDLEKAQDMHDRISGMLRPIDEGLAKAFPPVPVAVREVTPRLTQSGAFNLNDFRWFKGDDLTVFNGGPFTIVRYEEFNPGSPKQIVSRLNAAGWKPTDKTKGHIDALKDRKLAPERKKYFQEYGWKVSEENLKTLPDTAPEAAKNLGRRIVLQSRLSDLEEWIALIEKEGEGHVIRGDFNPIGAWTHRLSHQRPNLANVPVAKRSPKDTEFEALINDFNDEMRALFVSRPGHRLIGTDADGIQMRIFAHYVGDEALIKALVTGTKEDGTDIHTLHQKKLGAPCKSRDAAKTFIYAWLLGAGIAKVAEILGCSTTLAREAVDNFISSYPGLKELKQTIIPQDAKRGYFVGLDGRKVVCDSQHLMLAGYLQNGESVIMKRATVLWQDRLRKEGVPFRLCTWPHDEWQTEIPDNDELAKYVAEVQIQAIRDQADALGMRCPLEGTTTVQKTGFVGGYNWMETH